MKGTIKITCEGDEKGAKINTEPKLRDVDTAGRYAIVDSVLKALEFTDEDIEVIPVLISLLRRHAVTTKKEG